MDRMYTGELILLSAHGERNLEAVKEFSSRRKVVGEAANNVKSLLAETIASELPRPQPLHGGWRLTTVNNIATRLAKFLRTFVPMFWVLMEMRGGVKALAGVIRASLQIFVRVVKRQPPWRGWGLGSSEAIVSANTLNPATRSPQPRNMRISVTTIFVQVYTAVPSPHQSHSQSSRVHTQQAPYRSINLSFTAATQSLVPLAQPVPIKTALHGVAQSPRRLQPMRIDTRLWDQRPLAVVQTRGTRGIAISVGAGLNEECVDAGSHTRDANISKLRATSQRAKVRATLGAFVSPGPLRLKA
ncbi:hypothetical protein GGX14DRAFT_394123 [Mycena pura]|uniref:Uncharacterized protein n=1 Tax=Mycena pura TaxID=153505 RepID=A0AAD6VF97_9AGAR|nr:hypothetical protein GGX14DRAFT_394123 [Mycena pura]